MSTFTQVYLEVKLTLDTPNEIVNWLEANNDKYFVNTDKYEPLVPEIIKNTASRCEILHVNDNNQTYSFKSMDDGYALLLRGEHKNKDSDYEKLINYLLPYVDKTNSNGYIYYDSNYQLYYILFEPSDDPGVLKTKYVKNSSEFSIDLLDISLNDLKILPTLDLDTYYY